MPLDPITVTGLAITAIAYIIGTVPFGVVVSRWYGAADPRTQGSGNIGCTNVLRIAGKSAATLTFLLDAGKGTLAVWVTSYWFNGESEPWTYYSGIAAVLGHTYPVWTKFKGGKGVATAIGALTALSPLMALWTLLIWVVVAAVSRYVSLASITAACSLPLTTWWLEGNDLLVYSIPASVVVVTRHRENIRRLLQGRELRLGSRGG